jgi:hypothetical protein
MSKPFTSLAFALVVCCSVAASGQTPSGQTPNRRPAGPVRIVQHSFADDHGPFLGLGASYFTALWRCKNDRQRLENDLSFLSRHGFNYFRMLSMVGYYPAWDGLEIAPVAFTNKKDKRVEAWPEYWNQLKDLVDLAFDKYQLRTHITIFADAQLMPDRQARLDHMRTLLEQVVRGREHKIILLEVANEAWQNGFPGKQGVADLREFSAYLNARTDVPVAITSNHDLEDGFEKTYAKSAADLATWHFSRDRKASAGWEPVIDCWDFAAKPGFPPVISNEPIGPGASVASEKDPLKLVMAAAFAYVAKLPGYVFHSEAGVFGKTRFEETIAIDRFGALLRIIPPDVPSWSRFEGKSGEAPLRVFADGKIDRYWTDEHSASDGCLMNAGSQKGADFICVPIGIKSGGLQVEARKVVHFRVFDPLSGKELTSAKLRAGERLRLPAGPGALIILGQLERE